MKNIIIVLLFIMVSNGYAKNLLDDNDVISVVQAVDLLDKQNKPWSKKVKGVFEFTIRASGKEKNKGYLNSNLNYRTKYNLTIVLSKHIRKRLTEKYGKDPLDFFIGKKVRVKGEAKKAKIHKIENKKVTNLVYFQSHIVLDTIKNIEIVE